jgi:hypothetical protein
MRPNCTDPRKQLYAIGKPNATGIASRVGASCTPNAAGIMSRVDAIRTPNPTGHPDAKPRAKHRGRRTRVEASCTPNATGADIVALAVRVGKVLRGISLAVCGVMVAALASGCGETQRNAHEVARAYPVEVLAARFPAKQAMAHDTRLTLIVRNAGVRVIPNVAVTLTSFYYTSDYPKLSSRKRPVWVVNTGPGAVATNPPIQTEEINPAGGGETAFVNTWALGALAPHASRAFVWHVTPVKAGIHTVHYTVAAGVDGKARARLASGGLATGSLTAQIAPVPPATHVNPETGAIAPGPNPVPTAEQPASP